MPGLPHHILEMSRVRRLSAKTSVLVSLVKLVNCVIATPPRLAAAKLADDTPVPFGKFTPVKLFQVSGHGRKVSGSEINSSSLGIHLNSRSPVKRFVTPPGAGTVRNELWFHSF